MTCTTSENSLSLSSSRMMTMATKSTPSMSSTGWPTRTTTMSSFLLCMVFSWTCASSSAFAPPHPTNPTKSNTHVRAQQRAPASRLMMALDDSFGGTDDGADWREFRAKLVLEENGIERASEEQHQQWAYLQELLEPGTILLHDDSRKMLSRPYLYKSVLLVLDVNKKDTTALILNRLANVTLHEQHFTATLFYGGQHNSFHDAANQRIFCLHRQESCKDVSTRVMSGLYLCSLEDATKLHATGRAQPADFLYISGYETLDTQEMQKAIQKKTWKSITVDALTLQQALYHEDATRQTDGSTVHMNLLRMIGLSPARLGSFSMEDALLQEWQCTALYHGPPRFRYATPEPHNIQEGDLLRASSLDHAFLFDHLEFHKSIVLILEANEDTAVAALLSYPTVESCPQLHNLPIRHGGSDSNVLYVLHYMGQQIGGRRLGKGPFSICSVEEAALALERGICSRDQLLVVKGKKVFPRQKAALDFVHPDAAPEVWNILGHQQALDPLVVDDNVEIARDAWRVAGGREGKEDLSRLGKQATTAWVYSHLLADRDDLPPGQSPFTNNHGGGGGGGGRGNRGVGGGGGWDAMRP